MKTNFLGIFALANVLLVLSCAQTGKKTVEPSEKATAMVEQTLVYDTSDPQTILAAIEQTYGGWGDLWKKGDVQYTYHYHNPTLNKTDLSTERYIFDNEASYGHYTQHEINVMPNTAGEVTQCFDGEKTIVMVNGEKTDDPQANAVGAFLRGANYFWFVMPYKLNDKGTITTYEGQKEFNGSNYDILKVTYDAELTGKEQNDIYILYVNPETKLIDRFYFSLPFLGVNDPVLIADYEYEDIDGQLISTKRTYFLPNEQGEYGDEPSLVQTMTDVTFSNGFTTENLMN